MDDPMYESEGDRISRVLEEKARSALTVYERAKDRVEIYSDLKPEKDQIMREVKRSGSVPERKRMVAMRDSANEACEAYQEFYVASIRLRQLAELTRDLIGLDLLADHGGDGEGDCYEALEKDEERILQEIGKITKFIPQLELFIDGVL